MEKPDTSIAAKVPSLNYLITHYLIITIIILIFDDHSFDDKPWWHQALSLSLSLLLIFVFVSGFVFVFIAYLCLCLRLYRSSRSSLSSSRPWGWPSTPCQVCGTGTTNVKNHKIDFLCFSLRIRPKLTAVSSTPIESINALKNTSKRKIALLYVDRRNIDDQSHF